MNLGKVVTIQPKVPLSKGGGPKACKGPYLGMQGAPSGRAGGPSWGHMGPQGEQGTYLRESYLGVHKSHRCTTSKPLQVCPHPAQ